ncbi:GntR family transcriptional regulator [Roseomonas sp. CAU 1739]|uniref:GntR family transcriptional regulator n=1 Tax=Roseomonas sp. CAU 1739 TaxID=3140364 RepID=UPI00325B251E
MSRPPATDLHRDLARSIVEHLRGSSAEPGQVLSENGLAAVVGTSRSPVRGALQMLLDSEVLERRGDGRLVLRQLPAAHEEPLPGDAEAGAVDRLYWQIAEDRIAGRLPDLIGEAALMRRYDAPRGIVHRALLQVMGEGWVERAPAGGWRFLALIDGPGSYDESYRFRRAIEPAALLDPAFVLPPRIAARLRREQEGLLARLAEGPDPREVFELNSGFHLALMQASNNRFFADAGLRVTRLRRLVGYVIALDRSRLAAQSSEHLAILDRIEAGDRPGAAELLIRHLDAGRSSKARLLETSGQTIAALAQPSR